MNRLISLLVAVVMSFVGTAAMADEHASARSAEILLAKAVDKVKQDGPEKAFAAFNDSAGGFVAKELYVFVFDMKGVYQASGGNPKLVGTNAYDLKDAEGKYLVQEMIKIANETGKGQVNYVWLNRVDNRVEAKHSLVHRVGDYIVGVGYYQN